MVRLLSRCDIDSGVAVAMAVALIATTGASCTQTTEREARRGYNGALTSIEKGEWEEAETGLREAYDEGGHDQGHHPVHEPGAGLRIGRSRRA